jgi:hypothetical protein
MMSLLERLWKADSCNGLIFWAILVGAISAVFLTPLVLDLTSRLLNAPLYVPNPFAINYQVFVVFVFSPIVYCSVV